MDNPSGSIADSCHARAFYGLGASLLAGTIRQTCYACFEALTHAAWCFTSRGSVQSMNRAAFLPSQGHAPIRSEVVRPNDQSVANDPIGSFADIAGQLALSWGTRAAAH